PTREKPMKKKNVSLKTRIALGLGVLLLMMVAVAGAGYWGLDRAIAVMLNTLSGDAMLAEHSARARANTVGMRRYEKDIYINIASPEKRAEYLVKWSTERDHLADRLNDLQRYAVVDSDKKIIAQMKVDMATYLTGFNK